MVFSLYISRSSFSNWGKVEIWAPGGNILSTIPEGATPTDYRRYSDGYAYTDGTSMAAPHVAGVVALMLSVNPNLTPQQLQTNIINNANTITITVPDPGFWPWEWNRTRDIVVQKLNAYEAVKAVAIFNTRILANDTIEIIDTFDRQLTGIIEIPPFLNNRPVKIISHLAFSNQTQLTQITIPSSVTTIGNNAFQNTNNAPIYLEGRTSAPNTFDINWNSSGNPVYLNGNLCTHTSTTLMSINYTQHGHLCNTCRTFVSESNHNHNVEHIPLGTAPSGIAVHSSYCRCGHSVTVPCVSKIPHLPGDTVICTYCGQEFTNPLFMITLPNGESFVSNAPFTYDMFKQLAEHLEISNEYADFVLSTRSSTIDYEYDISLASILPSRKETLYECCE